MFTKRLLPLALTAAFVTVLAASAQERKDTTTKDPAVGMQRGALVGCQREAL